MASPSSNPSTVALVLPDDGTQRDEFVNGLVQGSRWEFGGGPRVLTYSLVLNEQMGTYPGGTPEPGPGATWEQRPDMAQAVRRALTAWSRVANIEFEEIVAPPGQYYFESAAHLTFAMTGNDLDAAFKPGTLGLGLFPDADYVELEVYLDGQGEHDRGTWPEPEGDVFFDDADEQFDFLDPGGVGFGIILHETAHALGLKHPHDDGGSERPTFDDLGIAAMDRMRHTVMSYDIVVPQAGPSGFVATPMPLDILAMQRIYGANLAYHTGADVYQLHNRNYRTLWDAGGMDTLSASSWAQSGGVVLDLREGAFSGRIDGPRRMAIAYDAVIENAIGSGQGDSLFGNAAGNSLDGRGGEDNLFGGGGDDRLMGAGGVDWLQGGAGKDILTGGANDLLLHGGAGFDTLRLSGESLDLREEPGIRDIERIDLTGRGADQLTLDAASVLDLSTATDVLRVTGDAADTVVIAGSFIDQGLFAGFHRYQLGAATLLVDAEITVVV